MNDKPGYRVKEAAECLSISVWKLKEEMYQGRIRYIKIGRRVVIPRWALEERLRPEAMKLLPMEMGTGKSTLKTDQEASQARAATRRRSSAP